MKIVKTFQLKIVIFTAVKNRCILHRRVFVMKVGSSLTAAPLLLLDSPSSLDFFCDILLSCRLKATFWFLYDRESSISFTTSKAIILGSKLIYYVYFSHF